MIQANELRLGNYVYPFDDIHLCSAEEIFLDYIWIHPDDLKNTNNLYPIPTTEEWLLKFGFEKKEGFVYSDGSISEKPVYVKDEFLIQFTHKGYGVVLMNYLTLKDGCDYKSCISDLNKLKEVLLEYKPSLHQVEASS